MKKFDSNKIYLLYWAVVLALVCFSACKKFYDPPLVFEQAEEATIPKREKCC